MRELSKQNFTFSGQGTFKIDDAITATDPMYASKKEYKSILKGISKELDELQNKMYAHNKYGVLVIFQAMDAAGKDSTIKKVLMNVNPQGTSVQSFKRPSENELDHDYLWRCFQPLPERGKIQVFNRSYYEEVLVVKVHPEILTKYQKVPQKLIENIDSVWEKRYEDITNFENYLSNNGIIVLKFFLHVSKKEQGKRLIARIEEQDKNWKFEEGDIKERALWNDYMAAYEEMIQKTSSENAPWHIIPADDKKNMQIIAAEKLRQTLASLPIDYPESNNERQETLRGLIKTIKEQDED